MCGITMLFLLPALQPIGPVTRAPISIVLMPTQGLLLARGLCANRIVMPGGGALGPHAHAFHSLTVFLSPPGQIEWRDEAPGGQVWRPAAGDAVVWPAGRVMDPRPERPCECLSILLARPFVAQVAASGGFAPELRPAVLRRDEFVTQTALALAEESSAATPGRGVLAEALGTALAVRLFRAAGEPVSPQAPGRLDPTALDAIVRYIDAHLDGELPVGRLAEVAGMSQWHFSRLFRTTTGLSPHQFIVRRRVERARELLDAPGRKLAVIAAEVGFASQSHLSAHFHRHYGVSPGEYAGRRATPRPR